MVFGISAVSFAVGGIALDWVLNKVPITKNVPEQFRSNVRNGLVLGGGFAVMSLLAKK